MVKKRNTPTNELMLNRIAMCFRIDKSIFLQPFFRGLWQAQKGLKTNEL